MKLQLAPPLGFLAALGGAGLAALWLLRTDPLPVSGEGPGTASGEAAAAPTVFFQLPAPFDTEEAIRQFTTRPLFAEGRRPFEPAPVAPEPPVVAVPELTPEPVETASEPLPSPQIRLLGVMVSGEVRKALIFDESTGQQTWLSEGEAVQGWTLIEVSNNSMRLKVEDAEIAFNLFEEPVP
jgi:hypothetical protein